MPKITVQKIPIWENLFGKSSCDVLFEICLFPHFGGGFPPTKVRKEGSVPGCLPRAFCKKRARTVWWETRNTAATRGRGKGWCSKKVGSTQASSGSSSLERPAPSSVEEGGTDGGAWSPSIAQRKHGALDHNDVLVRRGRLPGIA